MSEVQIFILFFMALVIGFVFGTTFHHSISPAESYRHHYIECKQNIEWCQYERPEVYEALMEIENA